MLKTEKEPVSGFYPWYVVMVLMLAQTFSFVDRMIMGLLVGPIRATFNISDTQYSLLAGLAFGIFYAVMGLPLARIADRKSRKVLISVGIAVWSVMTALCGLAQGFWTLFLARVGVGVGEAALSPAAYSLITDYFSKHVLARALSVYTAGVTIGSALAYIVGSKVIELVKGYDGFDLPVVGVIEGWQLTFFIVGIPGLIIAALVLLTVKEPERTGKLVSTESHNVDTGEVPIRAVLSFLMENKRSMLTHMSGMSIYVMVVYSLNVWGPTYLIRTFGFTPSQAGWSMGVAMLFGGTLGLLVGGSWGDKWFSRGQADAYSRVIIISVCAFIPFTAMLGITDDSTTGIICIAIAVFFSAFQGGLAGGVLQLMTPNRMRGQVTAVYFLLANLIGLGFGPTIIALITDYVFKNDADIGKSIALCAVVLCPIAIVIMVSGLKQIRESITRAAD